MMPCKLGPSSEQLLTGTHQLNDVVRNQSVASNNKIESTLAFANTAGSGQQNTDPKYVNANTVQTFDLNFF